MGAELLDVDGVVDYADDDPISLEAGAHRALAAAVAPHVRRLVLPGSV